MQDEQKFYQKILREIALKENCSSLEEIQKRFSEVSGVKVSKNTIRTNLHELGIFFQNCCKQALVKKSTKREQVEVVYAKKKLDSKTMESNYLE